MHFIHFQINKISKFVTKTFHHTVYIQEIARASGTMQKGAYMVLNSFKEAVF